MHNLNKHIVRFLLLSLLGGGIIAPLAHQLQHGLYAFSNLSSDKNASHVHPDFDAFSDESSHLQDTDFACVLCSFSLLGDRVDQTFYSVPNSGSIFYTTGLDILIVHGSLLTIRGPPTIL